MISRDPTIGMFLCHVSMKHAPDLATQAALSYVVSIIIKMSVSSNPGEVVNELGRLNPPQLQEGSPAQSIKSGFLAL